MNEKENLFTKKGDKAILQINVLGYNIDLVKESGKWMIEYIATENYDRKNLVIK